MRLVQLFRMGYCSELLPQGFGGFRVPSISALKCGEKAEMEIRRLLLKFTDRVMTKNNEDKSVN